MGDKQILIEDGTMASFGFDNPSEVIVDDEEEKDGK